jgi:integrase
MERKISDGLVWRPKPGGGFYKSIYFKKMYRGHFLRDSCKTSDPEEAKRKLRKWMTEIDHREDSGERPKRTFKEGVDKYFDDLKESPNALRPSTMLLYGRQADLLEPGIGNKYLPIWKDDLKSFIEKRRKTVGCKSINLSIELVRIINRKACYYWKDDKTNLSWIAHCPIVSFEKGPKGKPYPLSWSEQEVFFDLLSGIKRKASIVCVNTGLREYPLVNLSWAWEKYNSVLNETVFEIPSEFMKNGKPMVLILNRLARREVESLRGRHPELVFGLMDHVTDKAWYRAWNEAGLPTSEDIKKGVHNLRHTFGKRLRDAGVDSETRSDLLHHMPKGVTRHYSEPELKRLKAALETIVPRTELAQAPKVVSTVSV